MYFEYIEKFPIEQYIINNDIIYAHILEKSDRKETLKEHLELAIRYFLKIINAKNLGLIFYNFENKLLSEFSEKGKKLYREILFNTIYMHDIGKINYNFQYKKMKNTELKRKDTLDHSNSNHSMLSSLIYLNHYFLKFVQHEYKEEQNQLLVFLVLNAYVISRHHSSFDSFKDFKNKFLECGEQGWRLYTEDSILYQDIYKEPIIFKKKGLLENVFKSIDYTLKNMEEKDPSSSIYLYIYVRFLESLLLACDYYATSEFKNQRQIDYFGSIEDINKFYDIYINTDISRKIREYQIEDYKKEEDFQNIKDINILRNELFLEAEENLLRNIDENIFYLEAPTGSGKSNVGFNLSFQLLKEVPHLNKIFYVYPFNTLIEQNMETLNKVFGSSDIIEDISVINSLVPIKTMKEQDTEDSDVIKENYEISLLNRQFLHYPIILTTHVSIFNYLFGITKDNLFPLYQIANSVVILDEIQSYKNDIWKEIITFLKHYSEILNIKFIIMSATLPNLSQLIDQEVPTINLIKNTEKYFHHPLFKDRVKLEFSLLDIKDNVMDELFQHVITIAGESDKNILIEFIKKGSAMKFREILKKYYNSAAGKSSREVELLTGDDNSVEKSRIIEKIKNNRNTILVATQVIEAGVDIDMDIGYKDISKLDSEEQFLGRINRSCLKEDSIVYFFNLDNAASIYKNDVRKEKNITLVEEKIRDILKNKNFKVYYDYVLKRLNNKSKKLDDENFRKFLHDDITGLNFRNVEKKMTLIDQEYKYSVFLNRKIELGNGDILRGEEIWSQYIQLLKNNDLDYAEKKIKLSQKGAELNYFIYQVSNGDFSYNERIGDLYYIEDGEKYFVDGKFHRENFNKGVADFI